MDSPDTPSRRRLFRMSLGLATLPLLAACGSQSPAPIPSPASQPTVAPPSPASTSSLPPPLAIASAGPSVIARSTSLPEVDHATLIYATITGGLAFAPIGVAQGFFTKYGVNLETQFAQAGDSTAALIAGAAQFLIADGVLVSQGYFGGAPLRLFANVNRTNPYAIFSAPDITSVDQLRGRTIAIGQIGDASDVSVRVALKPSRLDIGGDVALLPGGNSPGRFAALASGQVGAAILEELTFATQASQRGFNLLVSIRQQALPWIAAGIVISEDFLQKAPNTVLAVLKGLLESIHFFADPANRDASMEVMAKDLKLDPSDPTVSDAYEAYYRRSLDYPDPQQAAVDALLAAFNGIDPGRYANADATKLIDHSFVNDLRASGYLAALGYTG